MSVGVLGCMAERLKTDLLEANGVVDIVAGPDSYKVIHIYQCVHLFIHLSI